MTGWDTPLNYSAVGVAAAATVGVIALARAKAPRLAVTLAPSVTWVTAGALVGWHARDLIAGPWFFPVLHLGWIACFWFGAAGVASLVAAVVHRPTRGLLAALTLTAGFAALFSAACAVALEASTVAYMGYGSWPIARGWTWTAHGAAVAGTLALLAAVVTGARASSQPDLRPAVAALAVAVAAAGGTAGYAAWVVWVLRQIPWDWAFYGIPSWVVTPGP